MTLQLSALSDLLFRLSKVSYKTSMNQIATIKWAQLI